MSYLLNISGYKKYVHGTDSNLSNTENEIYGEPGVQEENKFC